jgi:hypothetical protein
MATTPETTTTITTNIPKFVEPYVTRLLGETEAFTSPSKNPYQYYQGQRFADINPLQRQYMESATNMLPSWQTGAASNLAGEAGLRALDSGIFNNSAAGQYMSPYIQQVLNIQKQNAIRDYARQLPTLGAGAARFGGLGGSRNAIAMSEGQRNLQNSLQGIDATGLQNAFQAAMAQFNADMNRRMQGNEVALRGASTMGDLGKSEFTQRMDAANMQRTAGQDLYNLAQQQKDFDYQQFTEAQNYPYKQLGFASSIYRGLPTDETRNVYGAQPNTATTATGLVGAALSRGFAKGGLVGGLGGLYMRGA